MAILAKRKIVLSLMFLCLSFTSVALAVFDNDPAHYGITKFTLPDSEVRELLTKKYGLYGTKKIFSELLDIDSRTIDSFIKPLDEKKKRKSKVVDIFNQNLLSTDKELWSLYEQTEQATIILNQLIRNRGLEAIAKQLGLEPGQLGPPKNTPNQHFSITISLPSCISLNGNISKLLSMPKGGAASAAVADLPSVGVAAAAASAAGSAPGSITVPVASGDAVPPVAEVIGSDGVGEHAATQEDSAGTAAQASITIEKAKAYPPLDLHALPFGDSFPDTYSLFMADYSLVSKTAAWDGHAHLKDIGQQFLTPKLAEDKDLSLEEDESMALQKQRWLLKDEGTISDADGVKKEYCIIHLYEKKEERRTSKLIRSLTKHRKTDDKTGGDFDFVAGLIIFPYSPGKAMIYGLGRWERLLKKNCIVPQWGLRLVTSEQTCDTHKIKELSEAQYRSSNPVSKKAKAAVPQSIKGFGLEVNSEELKSISLMPSAIATRHVVKGNDYFQFTVNPKEHITAKQTLNSLHVIATHFYNLTTDPSFHVHPDMKEFIDDEIKDAGLLKVLNEHLQDVLKDQKAKQYVFLHDDIFKEMRSKKLMFGEEKNSSIFAFLAKIPHATSIPQTIQVWTSRTKLPRELDVLRMLYTLPLEYGGKFYRFDRTYWYEVSTSRFRGIIKELRKIKCPSKQLQLPGYSEEDTKRSGEGKVEYKEAKYNLRASEAVRKQPGWSAVLLDRINVSLGEAHGQFEFADLLLMHKNTFYIVHVKRAQANQLSHLREQVERSVDFLTTELIKTNARDIFLQGVVKSLYIKHGLPTPKGASKGKGIIKGHGFLDSYDQKEKKIRPGAPKDLEEFYERALKNTEREFFGRYPLEFATALDALYDCESKTKKPLRDMEVREFLEAVKQTIQARELLFPSGLIKKPDLSRIKVVLAIIDDSAVEAALKKKTTSSKQLFHRQDIWGLDRTRTMVEKTGLGFVLTVMNEKATETHDAFGAIDKEDLFPLTAVGGSEPSSLLLQGFLDADQSPSDEEDDAHVPPTASLPPPPPREDPLREYDYTGLQIHLMISKDMHRLDIRAKPLNPDVGPEVYYEIDGKKFHLQNVSGAGLRCFFNAAGLEPEPEIAKLKSKYDDPIVRYMIANEIVSAAADPDQIPEEVKKAIGYEKYAQQRAALDEIERQKSDALKQQTTDGDLQDTKILPEKFQRVGPEYAKNLEDLRLRAASLAAFDAFLDQHIGRANMMVALFDVKGEAGDNPNSNYTSIDAIAYVNKLGIKIYQMTAGGELRLAHSYVPEEAESIVYIYHEGFHFQALVPVSS